MKTAQTLVPRRCGIVWTRDCDTGLRPVRLMYGVESHLCSSIFRMGRRRRRPMSQLDSPKSEGRDRSRRCRILTVLIALVILFPSLVRAQTALPLPSATTQPAADTVVVDHETEEILKGATKYLASKQTVNGSWTGPEGHYPIGLTGYAIVAFLATGNQPGEGEYGRNMSRGIEFLLGCVHDDGFIGGPYADTSMYEHGIATITLAEVYGQAHNPALRSKLAKAVKIIIDSQNDKGGWRYHPVRADDDLSATVIQVVALRAAKNCGMDVPQSTIDRAIAYVKTCRDPVTGGFCYQPGEKQGPGFARTAAAIYSLQVCGDYNDPVIPQASAYMFANLNEKTYWFTYGCNYAAPAEYMIGGENWKSWYQLMRKRLLGKVQREGRLTYWEPVDKQVNSVYATSVYTTILAMPYHYLPLYQR